MIKSRREYLTNALLYNWDLAINPIDQNEQAEAEKRKSKGFKQQQFFYERSFLDYLKKLNFIHSIFSQDQNSNNNLSATIASLETIGFYYYSENTLAEGLKIAHGRNVSNKELRKAYNKILSDVYDNLQNSSELNDVLRKASVAIAYSNYAYILEHEASVITGKLDTKYWDYIVEQWPDIEEKWNFFRSHILRQYIGTTPQIPITEISSKAVDYWDTTNLTNNGTLQESATRYARLTIPFDPIVAGLFDLKPPVHRKEDASSFGTNNTEKVARIISQEVKPANDTTHYL